MMVLFSSYQMPHNINFREKKSKIRKDKKPEGQGEETLGVKGRVARFRYFQDISGYAGVRLSVTWFKIGSIIKKYFQ